MSATTLRAVLETASGLYHEVQHGIGYRERELIGCLSPETLDRHVVLEKQGDFIYGIRFDGTVGHAFILYSRRRLGRK